MFEPQGFSTVYLFDSRPHSWYSYDKQIRKIRVNLPTRGHERLVFFFRVSESCTNAHEFMGTSYANLLLHTRPCHI